MKKLFTVLCLISSVLLSSTAFADPWAVVATGTQYTKAGVYVAGTSATINTVDMGAIPPKVYGPFLQGKLGAAVAGNDALGIAMLPDGNAIVSSFSDKFLTLIDLTDPKNPKRAAQITLSFSPEDVYVAPMADVALVTDGGGSNKVAFIDLDNFTVNSVVSLGVPKAQAIAISPDDIVLVADYYNNEIWYGRLNSAHDDLDGALTPILLCDKYTKKKCTGHLAKPVRIAISPNGATALVGTEGVGGTVIVLKIATDGSSDVYPGNPFFLTGLPGGLPTDAANVRGTTDSIMFVDDSTAYVTSLPRNKNVLTNNVLSRLGIDDPGGVPSVFNDNDGIVMPATLTCKNSGAPSSKFGVNVLGISHDGSAAVVGCSTDMNNTKAFFNQFSYVNLMSGNVTTLTDKVRAQVYGVGVIGGSGQFNLKTQ